MTKRPESQQQKTKFGPGVASMSGFAATQPTFMIPSALSPGMVLTDFLLKRYEGKDPEEWKSARRIFNILADRVETVTPYLAEQVLKNQKNGARIQWLTGGKAFWRFLTAGFTKRDLFKDLELE